LYFPPSCTWLTKAEKVCSGEWLVSSRDTTVLRSAYRQRILPSLLACYGAWSRVELAWACRGQLIRTPLPTLVLCLILNFNIRPGTTVSLYQLVCGRLFPPPRKENQKVFEYVIRVAPFTPVKKTHRKNRKQQHFLGRRVQCAACIEKKEFNELYK